MAYAISKFCEMFTWNKQATNFFSQLLHVLCILYSAGKKLCRIFGRYYKTVKDVVENGLA